MKAVRYVSLALVAASLTLAGWARAHAADKAGEDAKIEKNLAKLSSGDRQLAEEQRWCPVQPENRLGVMGKPIKVTLKGSDGHEETVFVCCKGCVKEAKAEPDKVIAAATHKQPLSLTALAVHGVMTGVQDAAHEARLNAFDIVTPDGQPVRWNPCQSIHWRANVARGPVGGLDVLKAAVHHIAYVTATNWVYDGTTATVPSTSYLPQTPSNTNKPVVLGWTDGGSSDTERVLRC